MICGDLDQDEYVPSYDIRDLDQEEYVPSYDIR